MITYEKAYEIAAGCLILGAAVMIEGRNHMDGFLTGELIAAAGNFEMLLRKYKKYQGGITHE